MSFVFTERFNNSGFSRHRLFWFYVLPLGFLLTQYTITGFDACAHVSEETQGASTAAARGLWQSIFYSAIGGWVLLLAFLFAATDVDAINKAGGFVGAIFDTALPGTWPRSIFAISTIGQFFCGMSCVTSMSRMTYAFSRDGAIPGWRLWSKVDRNRTPVNAIIVGCVGRRCILTLPALYEAPAGIPLAFYAVVSVAVIGLYIAFVIPIWLRLRMGDRFQPGPVDAGAASTRSCAGSPSIEIVIVSIYFIMPLVPAGVPFSDGLHLDRGQLRADRGRRRAAGRRPVVGAVGPAMVHRPAPHGRRARSTRGRPSVRPTRVACGELTPSTGGGAIAGRREPLPDPSVHARPRGYRRCPDRARPACRCGGRCVAATPSRSRSPGWPRRSSSAWSPSASGCRPSGIWPSGCRSAG